MIERRKSRQVNCGKIKIGGEAPISVQSMVNKPASDIAATVAQIKSLETAGCDIVRLAIPDEGAACLISEAKKADVKVPLVADIHFDYKAALAAVSAGADKIRINPGNIGAEWKVREVAKACIEAGLPIRIGVNGGSLEKKLLEKYGAPTGEALAESALMQAEMLEKHGFSDIVISIKASSIENTVRACEIVAESSDYPIHLGVTEAGDTYSGLVKNSVGIGSLLLNGIGDTLRVSLTGDPLDEVRAGIEILRSVGLRRDGVRIVSCPTCGRTKLDLIGISAAFKKEAEMLDTHGKEITVAIMGCVVNGPGEAREADFGIAGGDGFGVLFEKGKTVGRVDEDKIVDTLIAHTKAYIEK